MLAAGAYLRPDQTEEQGEDEGQEEQKEDEGVEDEDEGAGVPARIEGREGAEAVVVSEVQGEVAEEGEESERVEQAPADGGVGELIALGFRGSLQPDAVENVYGCDDYAGFNGESDEAVGDSAMVLKAGDGAEEAPEGVDVGEFGAYRHGEGGVGRASIESGAGHAGTRQDVCNGFHAGASLARDGHGLHEPGTGFDLRLAGVEHGFELSRSHGVGTEAADRDEAGGVAERFGDLVPEEVGRGGGQENHATFGLGESEIEAPDDEGGAEAHAAVEIDHRVNGCGRRCGQPSRLNELCDCDEAETDAGAECTATFGKTERPEGEANEKEKAQRENAGSLLELREELGDVGLAGGVWADGYADRDGQGDCSDPAEDDVAELLEGFKGCECQTIDAVHDHHHEDGLQDEGWPEGKEVDVVSAHLAEANFLAEKEHRDIAAEEKRGEGDRPVEGSNTEEGGEEWKLAQYLSLPHDENDACAEAEFGDAYPLDQYLGRHAELPHPDSIPGEGFRLKIFFYFL